jgi:cobalt-zinc-cadmium efflux system outer membrane protein
LFNDSWSIESGPNTAPGSGGSLFGRSPGSGGVPYNNVPGSGEPILGGRPGASTPRVPTTLSNPSGLGGGENQQIGVEAVSDATLFAG